MLLYIQSKAYPGRTFVDICKPSDTVARVRAYLLHRLNEIGHSNHQFRLRYKGVYLRDAYTLEEYKLLNNAVIHMVPLNNVSEWNKDKRFFQSEKFEEDADDAVQTALKSEVKLLNLREKVLKVFSIILIMQIVVAFMALFTNYWYFFFAYGVVLLVSLFFSPSFTRVSGWVGTNSVRRKEYMIAMILLSLAMLGSSIALLVLNLNELVSNPYPTPRCSITTCLSDAGSDEIEIGICRDNQQRCYESSVWTAIYYSLVILFMLATTSLSAFLLHNFKFSPGDYIERYLVQTRDLSQILEAARNGSSSQKRSAAFELATMASSADDNKFQIVTEGGLDVLITLALSSDLTTQEYASEAIAECLTIPAIQDQFVEIGGMKTLTALLNSKNSRTNYEAIVALSYVVSDSDENKSAVVDGHGLDDLSYASKYSNSTNRKILASIFLELAYFAETRSILASRSSPAESLLHLLQRSSVNIQEEISDEDMETIRLSLQAFELLAIEEPSLISLQDELLPYLLSIATGTVDKKIQLLATKLLVYFTQTPESCDRLCSSPELTDRFLYFAHSSEPELLKVLATISFRITQSFKHRQHLISDGFLEFLTYLQNSSTERETWNIVDQAITTLQDKEKPNDDIQKHPRPPSASSSSSSQSSSSHSQHLQSSPPDQFQLDVPSTSTT